jgi:hypothetical protein
MFIARRTRRPNNAVNLVGAIQASTTVQTYVFSSGNVLFHLRASAILETGECAIRGRSAYIIKIMANDRWTESDKRTCLSRPTRLCEFAD